MQAEQPRLFVSLQIRRKLRTLSVCAKLNHFRNFREDGTGGIPKELQLFDIFSREIASIISGRKEMPPEDIVSLQVAHGQTYVKILGSSLARRLK